METRAMVAVVVAGAALSALFWIDPLFVPLALLGPLVAGGVLGWRLLPWWTAVVPWTVAGIGAVVSDWLVNQEDVGFHVALTVVMSGLAYAAWATARRLRRTRPAAA